MLMQNFSFYYKDSRPPKKADMLNQTFHSHQEKIHFSEASSLLQFDKTFIVAFLFLKDASLKKCFLFLCMFHLSSSAF